ncbi:MAG: hypothetical protein EAX96_16525 [Candidatus Lokiarchaeota archaeon]|nr:hypothetical protein [Candidatus Lokiarchaeota archaeon]
MPEIDDLISKIDKKQKSDASLKDQVQALKTQNLKLEKEIEELKKENKELKGKIEGMVDFPTDVLELRSIIGRQRAQISTFDDQLNEKDFRITELETELNVIKDNYNKSREKIQELLKQTIMIKEKEMEIDDLKNKMILMTQEFDQKKSELERTISTDLGSDIAEKNAKIKTLEAELENVNTNYDKMKEIVNNLRQKYHMEELTGDIAEFDLKQLEEELNLQLKEKEEQLKIAQEKITKLQDRQEKTNKQLEELNSQVIKSEAVIDELNQTIADYSREKDKEIQKVKRELEDEKKKLRREFDIEKEEIEKSSKDDLERMASVAEELDKITLERDKAHEELEKSKILVRNMKKVFDEVPDLQIFAIVSDAGPTSLENLAKAIGLGVAMTRRMAMNLERKGLVKIENEIVSLP